MKLVSYEGITVDGATSRDVSVKKWRGCQAETIFVQKHPEMSPSQCFFPRISRVSYTITVLSQWHNVFFFVQKQINKLIVSYITVIYHKAVFQVVFAATKKNIQKTSNIRGGLYTVTKIDLRLKGFFHFINYLCLYFSLYLYIYFILLISFFYDFMLFFLLLGMVVTTAPLEPL